MTVFSVNTRMIRRALIAGVALILAMLLLLIRILGIQTHDYEKYQTKVFEQMTTESPVKAERGKIYDTNGVTLATSVTTYRIFISPSDIKTAQGNLIDDSTDFAALIADGLSEILGVTRDFVLEQTTYTRYLDRTIARNVPKEKAKLVEAFILENELTHMVYLEATSTRYYPYGELSSHVLGFTGSDGVGLYGLEYYYNEELSGSAGKYITARDSHGREMPSSWEQYLPAQDGYNVGSTLDVFVSSVLEEQLKAAYLESGGKNRACGAVMDVKTGAVLAMSVYPPFDLNDPWALNEESAEKLGASGFGEDSDEYADLRRELLLKTWSNKMITEPYIPGSTFKIITSSMALEEKKVTLSERFYCPGYLKVSGITIHCHKEHGHGNLTFAEGIQQSCNPILMTVGLRVGVQTFYDYFTAFGYMEKSGIDLPGETYTTGGLFWDRAAMTTLNLATASFGQNFKITPLEQLTAVAAVANGGYLVTPHLLKELTDNDGNVIYTYEPEVRRQVVSSETCATVSGVLEEGVSGNGGAKNAYVAGYRIAAKTGTSEKVGEDKDSYICSCVGYAPADDPQYAAIIIVDEPTKGVLYGSTVAAPYLANVFEAILPYLGVEAVYSEAEESKMTVSIPSWTYWNVEPAKKQADWAGIDVVVIGDGTLVKSQIPEAGTVVEKESARVIFYTGDAKPGDNTVTVPKLVGMTAAAANQTLINSGLNIRIKGTKNYLSGTGATVVSQSLDPGTVVPLGTVVTVNFLYLDDDDSDADILFE